MNIGVSCWVLGSPCEFWGILMSLGGSWLALGASRFGFWGLPMNIGISQLGFGIS